MMQFINYVFWGGPPKFYLGHLKLAVTDPDGSLGITVGPGEQSRRVKT